VSGRRVVPVGGDGSDGRGAKRPSQLAGPRSSRGSAEGLNTTGVPLRVGIDGTETALGISSVWRRSGLALADKGSSPSTGTATDEWGRDEGDGECSRLRTAGRSSLFFGAAMMASVGSRTVQGPVSGKVIRPSKNIELISCFSSQSNWRLETNLLGGGATSWSSANASEALRRFVSEGLVWSGGWGILEVPVMGRSRKDVYGRPSAVRVVEGNSIPISRNRDRSIMTSPDIDQPVKVLCE
jgi:hypothetical protein